MRTRNSAHPRPWHRGSVFGPGERRPLDRNSRARWRYLVRVHTRAGRLTPKGEWVLEELLDHLARDGRCDPSHARLAACSYTSEDTVARTLETARRLGLIAWQRRIVRDGWRAHQTSNAYVLHAGVSEPPLQPPQGPAPFSKHLESGCMVALRVVDNSAARAAVSAEQTARIAAKFAEEKRMFRERLAATRGANRN